MRDIERIHPDIAVGAREIRVADSGGEISGLRDGPADSSSYRWATNMETSVVEIIRPIVLGADVTIVTGYASLLSVLSLVISLRPGITYADRGTVRIVLGEEDRPAGRSPCPAPLTPARLSAIFLHPSGVSMTDPRDVRAAQAREALEKGAIRVRVVDTTRLGRGMSGLQANLVVGEDFAALSSGGFSRRDMRERAVMADRVANDTRAFDARRRTAEALWNAGQNCTREVENIIDALFVPVDVPVVLRRAIEATRRFPLFSVGTTGSESDVHADLVGQALARTYENGFAFVGVPAGAGQSAISAALDRRLAFNTERMIGQVGMDPWRAHVETATGARWSDARIAEILGREAPLVLDGNVSAGDEETRVSALYRRLKCRHRPLRPVAGSGVSDFEDFPDIETGLIDVAPTRTQSAARDRMIEELGRARESALDDASALEIDHLCGLAAQSVEAALLAWKQGGMGMRVRTVSKQVPDLADQALLPMFDNDMPAPETRDTIGECLSTRGIRALDRARLSRIVDSGEPTLVLAEDGLVRHALARRLSDMVDAPVLGIVGEDARREAGISGRETPYQCADTPDVAMSIVSGSDAGGPRVVIASAAQAAEMTLAFVTSCVVISVPESPSELASALSSIDGLGKTAGRVRVASFALCSPPLPGIGPGLSEISGCVDAAIEQMRTVSDDAPDGVTDILSELENSLDGSGVEEVSSKGRIALASIESESVFTVFVLAGVASEADSAAHPPRLLVVCQEADSGREEILRNQVGCAAFLAGIDIPPQEEDPRISPALPDMHVLEAIGRHMSHLSHWDARPERMVALLEELAVFLGGPDATGEKLFSDLCLTSLEIICDRWQAHLRESRDLAAISDPGLEIAVQGLRERPVWEVDEIRADLEECLDQRIAADARRPRALHDRVVAILHGTGTGSGSSGM